jgi:uncharacterized protein (TIGR00369 family)
MSEDLGTTLVTGWLGASPFSSRAGIKLEAIEPGHAELYLPFDQAVTTIGDVVHGGAIATLIDCAATAASWAGATLPDNPRGATVSMSVNYVGAATGSSLTARATVVRRGRNLTFCNVEVAGGGGDIVATAIVTYKIG